MRINYGATDRKKMVNAIGEALEEKPIYQGVPSCAYQIAEFTVLKIPQIVPQLLHHPVTEQINSLSLAAPGASSLPLAC